MATEVQERVAAGAASARLWRPAAAHRYLPALAPLGTAMSARRFGQMFARAATAEAARGTGFVAAAALFAAGAVVYFSLPWEPWRPALLALVAMAAFGLLATRPGTAPRLAAAALLAALLGVAAGSFETWRAGTQMAGSAITTRLTARVVAIEEREGGRVRLTLDVISTERPSLRYAPERMRATARSVPETLLPGRVVSGAVRILPATGPTRPGGFDFSFESYFSRIGASGFFLTGPFEAEESTPPRASRRIEAAVESFRERLADHIRMRISGPEGEIAAALIAGVRGGITEADNEALRRTGLAHFISISGLHMALVAAIVLVAMRSAFALFPVFAARHPVKKYAAAVALVAIAAYLVISGQQVAAQRSFLMFAVMLVAVLFDRAALTMRNLAISVFVILAVWPHEIMGPSFQMSFAATGALIAGYAWFAERRRRRPAISDGGQAGTPAGVVRWVLAFFGGLAATSIIAGLATTLFGVWHFQRVSPLGLVANLAAMPLVSAVVMPAAVAGSLMIPLGLDGPIFAAMGWGLALVMDIARWLSDRSPMDAVGEIPASAVVVLSVALALATVATTPAIRALCLPFLVAGTLLTVSRELPDVLISEDGRLVAMRLADGGLAVNRPRPSAFTVWNWSHATSATGVVRPQTRKADKGEPPSQTPTTVNALAETPRRPDAPEKAGAMAAAMAAPMTGTPPGDAPFTCGGGLCIARHLGGAIVMHASDAEAARNACDAAAVLVIDDATVEDPCPGSDTLVVTKRDLARRGSAAIRFGGRAGPAITYAIAQEPRIWHRQRRFSREARGLEPYTPRTGSQPAAKADRLPEPTGPAAQ